MPRTSDFYSTYAWLKQRNDCYARDGYCCVDCGARGKQIGGTARLTADHIGPKLRDWVARGHAPEDYPLRWLKTRCDVCHGKKDGGHRR